MDIIFIKSCFLELYDFQCTTHFPLVSLCGISEKMYCIACTYAKNSNCSQSCNLIYVWAYAMILLNGISKYKWNITFLTLKYFNVYFLGSVTVYNKNLSEMQDLKEIRKITGVCPQHNVQFGALTVKENLTLFAKIKGILPPRVKQEVNGVLALPEFPLSSLSYSVFTQTTEFSQSFIYLCMNEMKRKKNPIRLPSLMDG